MESVRSREHGSSSCFLCGRVGGDLTSEHVFPQWLLRRFNLWNMRQRLINGTEIKYTHWKVPCCPECNATHLKPVEDAIADATLHGRASLASLPEHHLFLWPAKILYGSLYKMSTLERSLDARLNPNEKLVTTEVLESFEYMLLLLQAARMSIHLPSGFPASIMSVDTQCPESLDKRFFFFCNFSPPFLALRLGAVGLIAALEDGGALRDGFATLIDKCSGVPLHPLQFLELIAKTYYQLTLLDGGPPLLTVSGIDSIVAIPVPWSPRFRPHVQSDYARVLSAFLSLPFEQLYASDSDGVLSVLLDESDRVKHMSLEEFPDFPTGMGAPTRSS